MNRLSKSIAYLAGPIDRVSDRGVQWRQEISIFLRDLDIGVIDPCDKPIVGAIAERDDFIKSRTILKKAQKYDELHNIMRDIVATDLRSIDKADFIVLHVDTSVHMCGSYNEQTHAALQRKPVLVHCSNGLQDVPDWLYGICDHNEFFDNWSGLYNYIQEVALTNLEVSKRWKFFDYAKIYGKN